MKIITIHLAFLYSLLFLIPITDASGKETDAIEKQTVTAKLIKIPGKFPPDDLYDYAYVMQYQVIGGALDKKIILVAHYKPRQARAMIKDVMKKQVGGKLKRFQEGDIHQMTITADLRKIWKGAMVDDFFAKDRKSPRYWCLQVDPVKTK